MCGYIALPGTVVINSKVMVPDPMPMSNAVPAALP